MEIRVVVKGVRFAGAEIAWRLITVVPITVFRTFHAQEPPDGILVPPSATSSLLGARRHHVLLVHAVFVKMYFPVR